MSPLPDDPKLKAPAERRGDKFISQDEEFTVRDRDGKVIRRDGKPPEEVK